MAHAAAPVAGETEAVGALVARGAVPVAPVLALLADLAVPGVRLLRPASRDVVVVVVVAAERPDELREPVAVAEQRAAEHLVDVLRHVRRGQGGLLPGPLPEPAVHVLLEDVVVLQEGRRQRWQVNGLRGAGGEGCEARAGPHPGVFLAGAGPAVLVLVVAGGARAQGLEEVVELVLALARALRAAAAGAGRAAGEAVLDTGAGSLAAGLAVALGGRRLANAGPFVCLRDGSSRCQFWVRCRLREGGD